MGIESKLALAIRTILVTTRVAVKSNQAMGQDGLAVQSARAGETLLNDLGSRLPRDSTADVLARYDDARGRMAAIVADASRRAASVGDGEGPLDEEVDVGAELDPKL